MTMTLLNGKQTITLSTNDVERRHSFDYWRDVVCNNVINVDCRNPKSSGDFFGKLRLERYADITLSEMRSQPAIFIRKNEHIQKSPNDFLLLTLRLGSRASKIIDSKRLKTSWGDLSFYHGTRASLLHVDESIDALVCNIPLKLLTNHIKKPEDLHGAFLSARSPMGSLASNYLLTLAKNVSYYSGRDQPRLFENFFQLLSIALERSEGVGESCVPIVQKSMILQIKEFILCNLANQELSPDNLAARFRISPRYLYSLFKSEKTTPCEFILNARLNSAAHQLSNPSGRPKSISEIAFDVGFNNISHFCRRFKQKFHVTPSEFRNGHETVCTRACC